MAQLLHPLALNRAAEDGMLPPERLLIPAREYIAGMGLA
jgi:hypothetical protein